MNDSAHDVYLGLGSNLGDREGYLRRTVEELIRLLRPSQWRLSSLYETDPVGMTEQPLFLNACLFLRTRHTLSEVYEATRNTESHLGRVRTVRWGPRTVDIDILLFDDLVVKTEELQIPHPRMHERAFVMVPLAELAPGLVHPVLGMTAAALAAQVVKRGGIRRCKATWEGEFVPFGN